MSTKMFQRTAQRVGWLALTLGMSACNDGSSTHVSTRERDSGTDGEVEEDGSEADAATDEEDGSSAGPETPPTLVSDDGSVRCAPVPLSAPNSWAEACWVDEEHTICGVDTSQLPNGDPAAGPSCVAQDAPGVPSEYCGAFFDQIDGLLRDAMNALVRDDQGNPTYDERYSDGALTIDNDPLLLKFSGCCLPTGECGAQLDAPYFGPAMSTLPAFNGETFSLHLGCTSVTDLLARLGDPSAETLGPKELAHLPYCDPDAEGAGAPTSGTVPGAPAFVCGCGLDAIDDDSGRFPCLNGLPVEVCGADAPNAEELALVPEFICGAISAPAGALPTLPNVAASTCGTLAVTTAAPLVGFPETLCGCGDGVLGSGACLSNVPATLCGGVAFAGSSFAGLPDYLCGCGEGVPALGRPCISNVVNTVCGAVVGANPAEQAGLPAFVCGCGPDNAYDPVGLNSNIPCLSHRDGVTCGSVPATVGATIPRLPKLLCGCGVGVYGGENELGVPCLPNTPMLACGELEPTTAQLANVRPYFCGCGATRALSAAPCINYLPTTTCGTNILPPVEGQTDPGYESDFYAFRGLFLVSVFGCGTSVSWVPPATGDMPDVLSNYCFSRSEEYRQGRLPASP